ncbi:MAG TPA: hypothetical protein VGF38_21080 [Ktedonobacterales bacterium]|jgi:predicted transposase
MKQTLLVKLAPTPDQHAALLRTLETFNAACNDIAGTAFTERCANKIALQQLVYYDIRKQFGLSSQMVIRAISKVSEAYKRDKTKQPHFRAHGAMVYDERICSFPRIDRVSLLTLDGRIEVPFRFGAYAEGMMGRKRGQADLLYRNDTFFLAVTVDAPEPIPAAADTFLGVDLGIMQLATTSDGEFLNSSAGPKHGHVNQVRARYSRFRAKLQKKGTKSAKRLLRKRRGREKRFAKDVNHCLFEGACADGERHFARDCSRRFAGHPRTGNAREANGYQTPQACAAQLELLPTSRLHCLQGGAGWRARGLRQPGVYQSDL